METTSKPHLQSKGLEMITAFEFIKLNIKSESEWGQIANGSHKLKMWKWYLLKVIRITANLAFWIFILYNIFF